MYADSSSQTSPAEHHYHRGTMRANDRRTLVFVHVQVIVIVVIELIIVLEGIF